MTSLELCFLLSVAVAVVMLGRGRGWLRNSLIFPAIVIVSLFVLVASGGFRWQLIPAVLSVILYLFCIVRPPSGTAEEQAARNKRARSGILILLSASAFLATLIPLATLPEPDGSLAVGTQTYKLIDRGRREVFSIDPSKSREIMIQVWYPAQPSTTGKIAAYMPDFSEPSPYWQAPLAAIPASHLHLIHTHSRLAAPFAGVKQSYPVLIFTHGLMGGRIQNTVQAEELASHGFVVVGIDHTYDCSFAIFPEKVICSQLLAGRSLSVPSLADSTISVRVADVRFVLDQLKKLNEKDETGLLTGRLNLDEIGIYGHSAGGQTAMIACAQDKRLKAGLSMDGVAKVDPAALSQPFMFMQAERKDDPLGIEAMCAHLRAPNYIVSLKGSGHANFTDLPLLTPLHWVIMLSGPIDGRRAMSIIDAYSLAFFKQTLQGEHQILLDGASTEFPEIIFKRSK